MPGYPSAGTKAQKCDQYRPARHPVKDFCFHSLSKEFLVFHTTCVGQMPRLWLLLAAHLSDFTYISRKTMGTAPVPGCHCRMFQYFQEDIHASGWMLTLVFNVNGGLR